MYTPLVVPAGSTLEAVAGQIYSNLQQQLQPLGFGIEYRNLPLYTLLAKMHKSPVGYRFVSASSKVATTHMAVWINEFFRATHKAVVCIGKNALSDIPGINLDMARPWHVHSTTEAVRAIQVFNDYALPWEQYVTSEGMQSFDFARLYTNIPIADLHTQLTELVDLIFAVQGARGGWLQVSKDPRYTPKWHDRHSNPLPTLSTSFTVKDGSFHTFVFDAQRAAASIGVLLDNTFVRFGGTIYQQASVGVLLDNTFVRFGGTIYQQRQGIPMGTNPAVFYSNVIPIQI